MNFNWATSVTIAAYGVVRRIVNWIVSVDTIQFVRCLLDGDTEKTNGSVSLSVHEGAYVAVDDAVWGVGRAVTGAAYDNALWAVDAAVWWAVDAAVEGAVRRAVVNDPPVNPALCAFLSDGSGGGVL